MSFNPNFACFYIERTHFISRYDHNIWLKILIYIYLRYPHLNEKPKGKLKANIFDVNLMNYILWTRIFLYLYTIIGNNYFQGNMSTYIDLETITELSFEIVYWMIYSKFPFMSKMCNFN